MQDLPPHPHATLFPLLQGDEFQALVEDIKANGLRQPIILYRNQILDGRNRYRACIEAGVEPRFTEFAGTDDEALAYVISANLHRRHLTTCQRAVLALQLLPGERDRARERMNLGRPPKVEPQQNVAEVPEPRGQATELAGAKVGVSKETVRQAVVIADNNPDVIGAMGDGTVKSMGEARRLAELREDRRERVLTKMRESGCSLREADTAPTIWTRRGSPDWFTPPDLLETACRVLGGPIDLDPASCSEAQENVQAERYFTIEDDGLQQPWPADRCWCNPPYGGVGSGGRESIAATWIQKAIAEVEAGRTKRALLLVRAAVDTRWFQPLWQFPIAFLIGRIPFIPGPLHKGTRPNTAVCVAALGDIDLDRFVSEFKAWGQVVVPGADGTSMPVP